ncbi:MAG TPA: ABC transporter permease [Candidatus Limnocylindrales bacterium]|nr:ABC transporter permease [Candidatus Limnocylindrales bacterium]
MANKATMNFGEAVRIATASLWAHKLRSVLTLLGVVIGVMSVIAVVSIVNGLNRYVAEKVFNLGADVFLVSRGPIIITNIDDYQETQKRRKLRLDDYEWVRDNCRSCAAVGASIDKQNALVKYGTDYLSNTHVLGWTGEMPQLYELDLMEGRHVTPLDVSHATPVCAIGYDLGQQLLAGTDPIGKEIRIDTFGCQVIGVGKKLGSVMGMSRDNWLILPITTFQKAYGSDDSIRIWAKSVKGAAGVDESMDEVRLLLRGRRHVAYNSPDDFAIETNDSFLSLWGSISGAFFGVTIVIASISLIVGGIVIMNIMLVSVTERTREIGLRKSLGARRFDIQLQFLIESSTISAIGGVWGVILGILLAKFVTLTTSLPSSVQLWSVLMGLIVATGVGLFFGVYPASKAARLDPVVALRAE